MFTLILSPANTKIFAQEFAPLPVENHPCFTIDTEFETLFPPSTPDELENLEQSLLTDGFHDWEPLLVWREEQILIDGHQRYRICQKHHIPFKIVERTFPDRDAAIFAALEVQLARRNLSIYDRGVLALRYKDRISREARERQRCGRGGVLLLMNSPKAIDTRAEVASIAGVSPDTISKIERIERDAPVEIKKQLKSGEISIHAAYTALKPSGYLQNIMSSDSVEWYTPKEIIDAVIDVLGAIDLDPCSNSHEAPNVPAQTHFTKEDDGLSRPWSGKIFLNPPYGDQLPKWIAKLKDELQVGNITEAVVLVAARPETRWFNSLNDFIWCSIVGRLSFSGENSRGRAPFPSAAFYFGNHPDKFISVFRKFGPIYQKIDGGVS